MYPVVGFGCLWVWCVGGALAFCRRMQKTGQTVWQAKHSMHHVILGPGYGHSKQQLWARTASKADHQWSSTYPHAARKPVTLRISSSLAVMRVVHCDFLMVHNCLFAIRAYNDWSPNPEGQACNAAEILFASLVQCKADGTANPNKGRPKAVSIQSKYGQNILFTSV